MFVHTASYKSTIICFMNWKIMRNGKIVISIKICILSDVLILFGT